MYAELEERRKELSIDDQMRISASKRKENPIRMGSSKPSAQLQSAVRKQRKILEQMMRNDRCNRSTPWFSL